MDKVGQIVENNKKLMIKLKNKKSLNEIKKEAEDFVSTRDKKLRFQEKFNNIRIMSTNRFWMELNTISRIFFVFNTHNNIIFIIRSNF